MSALEELLGKIYDNGVEVEGLGGLNFIGFTITPDTVNMRYNIAISGAATTSDDVSNESTVAGSTVTAALNTLSSSVGTNTANISTNTTKIANLTIAGAGKIPYVSGTPGTYSASGFTTDGLSLFLVDGTGNGMFRVSHGQFLFSGLGTSTTNRVLGRWGLDGNNILRFGEGTETAEIWLRVVGSIDLKWTPTGLDLASKALTSVASINGAKVAAPVEGTALTDADQTLNVSGGNDYTQSTALTASRTKTLGTSGSPETGEVITIKRFTTAAFTMPVVNGGGGGGTLYTFPSGGKRVADFRYDGTNWVFAGCKRLA